MWFRGKRETKWEGYVQTTGILTSIFLHATLQLQQGPKNTLAIKYCLVLNV